MPSFGGLKMRVGQILAHNPHLEHVLSFTDITGGSINLFSIIFCFSKLFVNLVHASPGLAPVATGEWPAPRFRAC
jgi:hypothetical protein